jgi:hypothetical protein
MLKLVRTIIKQDGEKIFKLSIGDNISYWSGEHKTSPLRYCTIMRIISFPLNNQEGLLIAPHCYTNTGVLEEHSIAPIVRREPIANLETYIFVSRIVEQVLVLHNCRGQCNWTHSATNSHLVYRTEQGFENRSRKACYL